MPHPLDGCWSKIERANEHINNLCPEIDVFVRANYHAYRVASNLDRETGEYTITSFDDGVSEPPLRFSVIIGEVIHHLRTSLDHLVWALASERHPHLSDKVGFPICETAAQFDRARKNGMIKGISQRALGIIDSVQPYREKEPRKSELFLLHTLCNTDKHRLLITACGVVAQPLIGVDPGGSDIEIRLPDASTCRFRRPTKSGTEVFRCTFDRVNPETQVNLEVSAQVAFEKLGPDNLVFVYPGLTKLRDATIKTLELFRSEF